MLETKKKYIGGNARGITTQVRNKKIIPSFPGGTVVKSPPANAGDMGSSPSPGRSHMLRSN